MSYKKHYNFLSKEDLKIVTEEAYGYMKDPDTAFNINFSRWDPAIVKDSNVVLMLPLFDGGFIYKKESKATKILMESLTRQFSTPPGGLSFFYWSNGSYIPWHNDVNRSKACTLYLNEKWDIFWGGYFAAKLEEDNIMIKPEKNLLIEQWDNIWHCTTPTTNLADVRISVQAFWG